MDNINETTTVSNEGGDSDAIIEKPPFIADWSSKDHASFAPNNVPLRRIPRAWERKPYSPLARKTQVRKIWRRIQLPIFPIASKISALQCDAHPHGGNTQSSPKKVVKKSRLDDCFGQQSRTTDWEREKTRHARM